jgi:hypothetical protein
MKKFSGRENIGDTLQNFHAFGEISLPFCELLRNFAKLLLQNFAKFHKKRFNLVFHEIKNQLSYPS